MSEIRKDLHEVNRLAWNVATDAHNSHKHDQAAYFRNGGSTLFPDEIELLGDLGGKTLLHLQCNAGQDTLSLARLGAVVTGVDISDTAIAFAQQLATDSGIPATFHRSDVYDWLATDENRYDIVFSSYGALNWLSDLPTWGVGIGRLLKPGGKVVILDFHPVFGIFDDDEQWMAAFDYMGGKHYTFEVGIGDYVGMSGEALTPSGWLDGVQDFQNPHASHEFLWGVADIVMALVGGGLRLTLLKEYPYSNGFKRFGNMRAIEGNRYIMPEDKPQQIPLMLGVIAEK